MTSQFATPGIYLVEKNAFPGSVVAIETAIPVFIGYTEKAGQNGKSLTGQPTRITSFADYTELFGEGFKHQFELIDKSKKIEKFTPDLIGESSLKFYFYNCIRLFYQNGGENCFIMSLGTYGNGINKKEKIDISDFPDSVFEKLGKEVEPTMVIIPDFVMDRDNCYALYKKVLAHCGNTQSRVGIFDVIPAKDDLDMEDTFSKFRDAIGLEALSYGAAYYPWLNSSVVQDSEVDFTNLAITPDDLIAVLPEVNVKVIITDWNNANKLVESSASPAKETGEELSRRNKILHQSLVTASPTYVLIMEEIRKRLNVLPPSAAMAGIYSLVDNTRGVWKAPANISVSAVNSPAVIISGEQQATMNVDAMTGKSINAIRLFAGEGCLVWGARTLDGNSQDWRYINVRRTMIMIEQSLKVACKAYVFEPNDSTTWMTIKSMVNNFLDSLWKQGALAGAGPEQAFDVQVGLGITMTPEDIVDGLLRITIKVALAHPAEFIIFTFQQQQQQQSS